MHVICQGWLWYEVRWVRTLEAPGEGGLDLAARKAGLLLDDAQRLRVGDARVPAVARHLAVAAQAMVHLHHRRKALRSPICHEPLKSRFGTSPRL